MISGASAKRAARSVAPAKENFAKAHGDIIFVSVNRLIIGNQPSNGNRSYKWKRADILRRSSSSYGKICDSPHDAIGRIDTNSRKSSRGSRGIRTLPIKSEPPPNRYKYRLIPQNSAERLNRFPNVSEPIIHRR